MNGPFGDLERLARHLEARLETHPGYADVLHLRALARAQQGDVSGAQSDFEAALGVNPDYAVARFGLAGLLLASGDAAAVARAVDVARPLPEAWRQHLEIVRTANTRGPEAALAALQTSLAASGPWIDLNRLWLLVTAERWSEADQVLLQIAAADAELPALLHASGLFASGAADRARVATWAATYRGNPHFAALSTLAAELAHAAGDVEGSRRLFAWSAVLSLDLCAYWTAVGAQHESLGEESSALMALSRAVQVDPERVEPHTALGFLFAARGQPAEAIGELEIALRLAPSYPDVRYQLGLLYGEVGRADAAEEQLRAALDVQPSYVLAQLALGCLLESCGRDEEALALLQGVRRAGVRSADLESHLAGLHARLGHRNQARRAQARARASLRRGAPLE